MAQQIKKKFIGADQIDGSKIKLSQGQAIRGTNSLGQEVELVKVSSTDKVEVLGQEVALKSELNQEISDRQSGDSSTLASAQAYADQKIAALVNSAPEVLDTLKELSDALGGDANFASTITGQIGAVDSKVNSEISARQSADSALQSDIDSLEQIVDGNFELQQSDIDGLRSDVDALALADANLQSQIDALNTNFATDAELSSAVSLLEASISSEASRAQGEEQRIESKFDGMIASEQSARISTDTALQNEIDAEQSARIAAVASLQSQIDALDGNFVTESELAAEVASLQSEIDNVDGYAQEIRDDLDNLDGYAQEIRSDLDEEISTRQSADSALDSRVTALEAKGYSKGVVVVGAELSHIDLDRQYGLLLSVAVGRLMVHEGEDFTVSVVGGKTRLTWIGSLVNPGGDEAIETGDKVFYSGAF